MKIDSNAGPLPSGKGCRIAVVAARFNASVVDALLDGCRKTLMEAGVREKDIRALRVPGAFELPLACLRLAKTRRYHAVIALGCVIRGETPHDRYINHAVAEGLMRAGLDTGVPVIFGVLTPLDEKQARARLGKGREAAQAALEMAILMKGLR